MTFPGYQDTTGSNESSFVSTHTITTPATKTADDIWLLAWVMTGSGGTVTGPSGWTEIVSFDLFSNQKFRVWLYRATGSESGSVTVTTTLNNRSAAIVRRYSGVSTEDINDVWAAATPVYEFTTNPDPGSVTSLWGAEDNIFVALACHAGRGNAFSAYPASYSNGVAEEEPNDVGVAGADRQLAAVSDDPGTFTIAADENTAAVTIVLKPVVGLQASVADSGSASDGDLAELQSAPRPADVGVATDSVSIDLRLVVPVNNFPIVPLETRIEMEFGGTLFDLSDRLVSQQLDPARGRADESSQTEPGSLTVELDNADGHLTPHNPNSPYYPHVDTGALLRHSVRAGAPALILPGDPDSYVVTADDPDLDVVDLDVRMRVDPTVWNDRTQWMAGRWDFANSQRSWLVGVYAESYPFLTWSTNGTSGASIFRATPLHQAALRPIWLGWTLDVNNGAGGYDVFFWRSDLDVPPSDITTWTLIAQLLGGSTTFIHPGTAPLVVGGIADFQGFDGRILAFQQRASINGPLIAEVDFSTTEIGSKAFVDMANKTWTVSGQAQINNWRNRFVGTADEMVTPWPAGDNEPQYRPADLAQETITLNWNGTDLRTSEHRLVVTANGVLRRLGQGQSPIRSSLYRFMLGGWQASNIIAYWPMEERKGAGRFTAALDHGDMSLDGTMALESQDSLLASAPLPVVEDGNTATLEGIVPDGSSTSWAVEWFAFIETPTTNPTATRLMTVRTDGTVAVWQFSISDTTFYLRGFNATGGTVVTNDVGITPDLFDRWLTWRLEATQNGADVDFQLSFTRVDEGTIAYIRQDTVSSADLGRVTIVGGEISSAPDGYALGHVIVSNTTPESWLAGADTAWVGESAGHRFYRLCREEGVAVETIGETEQATLRGDINASQVMGPQERKTLLELLYECSTIDGGIIVERRGLPGLAYRTRASMENQAAQMVLDASLNQITNPFEPRVDDQNVFNQVTVSATFGTSAQVIDQASIDVRGVYNDDPVVAGVGGVDVQDAIVVFREGLRESIVRQNADLASWRVHLGVWPGIRYPTVTIPLDIALDQVEPWLNLAIGDRIQIINLPAQLPDEIVDLIVNHTTDQMQPMFWRPQLVCRPGGPWIIGELE